MTTTPLFHPKDIRNKLTMNHAQTEELMAQLAAPSVLMSS
jgi:hypothetical protein